MKIIECGNKVITKINKIEGMITACIIRGNNVSYEVSYFDMNLEYKQVWLSIYEFDSEINTKMNIGFNSE